MHDAARITPLGESLAVVLRTGRNAIVAYRLDPDVSGAYQRAWRTLVEPGSSILLVSITSGSFDVFGQLQNHLRIFVDVDAGTPATLAVGVVSTPFANFTFRAHSEYFGEPIAASTGALLTRVASSDGRRVGSTVIDTHNLAELHGVRATPGGFVFGGRVLSEVRSDGSGWMRSLRLSAAMAFPVRTVWSMSIEATCCSMSQCCLAAISRAGHHGYCRTHPARVYPKAAQPLLALLNSDGSLAQNLGYTGGARHNQLTTIASRNGRWLLGGMINGPGTHSGDADRNLIVADGFLREGSICRPSEPRFLSPKASSPTMIAVATSHHNRNFTIRMGQPSGRLARNGVRGEVNSAAKAGWSNERGYD